MASLDVGYGPDLGLDTGDDLVVTHRTATSLSVAVRCDHELAAFDAVRAAQLAEHDLIIYTPDEHNTTILTWLSSASLDHRGNIHAVDGVLGALTLAAAGVGVAIGSPAMHRIVMPKLAYRPLYGAVADVRVVTISRSTETSGPVRALLKAFTRSAGAFRRSR
jgi:DNA-binding transcriptional LysR family regulator